MAKRAGCRTSRKVQVRERTGRPTPHRPPQSSCVHLAAGRLVASCSGLPSVPHRVARIWATIQRRCGMRWRSSRATSSRWSTSATTTLSTRSSRRRATTISARASRSCSSAHSSATTDGEAIACREKGGARGHDALRAARRRRRAEGTRTGRPRAPRAGAKLREGDESATVHGYLSYSCMYGPG